MSYGHSTSLLPYAMQDTYSRIHHWQEHPTAVLENRILRAEFLLDLGGRLWSLYHKPSQTELLARSPGVTFANLGLCNAWFRGGVEWNVSTTGHSPLTCLPVFAAQLQDGQGNPVLRLYEWERLRQVVVQIDAFLPEGSPVLLLCPRILHPGTQDVPMYWWSNLAVTQTPGMRVLIPAEGVYVLGSAGQGLYHSPIPRANDIDITYPENWSHAADLFFDLQAGTRPWICAVSAGGQGVFHVSTDRMRGRKLWVWGTSQGGRNWQELLSPQGSPYIEIQAGLTCTQLEHLRMPAGAAWSWMEAYGHLQAVPEVVHGDDWQAACRHIEEEIDHQIPAQALEATYQLAVTLADDPPERLLHRGSGWGPLERRRREKAGDLEPLPNGVVFDDLALGEDQRPWVRLLEDGSFPTRPPDRPPRGFLVGDEWRERLERSMGRPGAGSWDAWLHLGIMSWFSGDEAGAEASWQRSLAETWSPWACRNLAVLKWEQGHLADAAELMRAACIGAPGQIELLVECGTLLVAAGRSRDWLELLAAVTPPIRAQGRLRLLEAQAALIQGQLPLVEAFLAARIVPEDLREGETSLSDLWYAYQEQIHSVELPKGQAALRSAPDRRLFRVPPQLDYVLR